MFKLNTNYRSTKRIVQTARALIGYSYLDEGRKPYEKETRARDDAGEGVEITLARPETARDEARWVTSQIQEMLSGGAHPEDFFIIARTNAALALTEEELTTAGIPAISSSGSFWDNNRVADVVSILALAYNPHDDAAFLRCYDIPSPEWGLTTRRLGKRFIEDVQNTQAPPYAPTPPSLWDRMQALKRMDKPFRVRAMDDLIQYREKLGDDLFDLPLEDVFACVIADYSNWWVRKEGPESVEDLEILEPLPHIAQRVQTMDRLFGHIGGMKQAQKNKNRAGCVILSTIHGAKGLERPTVFAIGMSDGVLPHWMADGEIQVKTARGVMNRGRMPPSPYDGNILDERCAAYVLITRAKERLFISAPREVGSKVELEPSRFIPEMGLKVEDFRVVGERPEEDESRVAQLQRP